MKTRSVRVVLLLLGLTLAGFIAGPPIADIKVGVHDATTPASREQEWWTARHDRFNAIAKAAKEGRVVDLVFLGDSITQGWEGAGKDVWANQYGSRNAVNFGIGGDRTQHVLWRIEHGNFDGLKPKLIVLMIGTNNSGSNTPREIADGIIRILQRLRTNVPGAKILLLGIFPRGASDSDALRTTNRTTNAILKRLNDGDTIHYLDIGDVFLEEDGTLSTQIMPDRLHLSAAGYTRWAQAIEPKVAELLGEV